ncbi:MAG: hypothetical protein C0605_06355 [Hyphomicrobiales bacterium]|nr:MAG: hypothetical protein C0605_06355 [Hyphomicrobiales bacterium]
MGVRLFTMAAALWLWAGAASADVAVLVQGYLGDAGSWRQTGVTAELQASGWRDGGHYVEGPRGVLRYGGPIPEGNRFVTLDLPTEAPVPVQAGILAAIIQAVTGPGSKESVHLIGHSAGGVVARFYMVRASAAHRMAPVASLITIASPHLGTSAAESGLAAGQSPLGVLAPLFGGGTINRSQGLYSDLVPERPGSLLGWLNRQPHPKAEYISIIRDGDGSGIVPPWSQDMTRVPALAGKARSMISANGHGLRLGDGLIIARVLKDVARTVNVNAAPAPEGKHG